MVFQMPFLLSIIFWLSLLTTHTATYPWASSSVQGLSNPPQAGWVTSSPVPSAHLFGVLFSDFLPYLRTWIAYAYTPSSPDCELLPVKGHVSIVFVFSQPVMVPGTSLTLTHCFFDEWMDERMEKWMREPCWRGIFRTETSLEKWGNAFIREGG